MSEPSDPRQAAHDAVYAYIRSSDRVPGDLATRNAMIWRAVTAALDAAGLPGQHVPAPAVRELAEDLLARGADYKNRRDKHISSTESRTTAQAIIDASLRFAEAAGLPGDFDFRQIRDAAVEMTTPDPAAGPTVAEAAATDRAHWTDKYAGEGK